jgi:hypothetical protein
LPAPRGQAAGRHLHAANGAFAGRLNHVDAIGRRAIADNFAIDLRATRLCVLEFLNHNHTATARDDKAVPVAVEGP